MGDDVGSPDVSDDACRFCLGVGFHREACVEMDRVVERFQRDATRLLASYGGDEDYGF